MVTMMIRFGRLSRLLLGKSDAGSLESGVLILKLHVRVGEKSTMIPHVNCDPFRDPFSGLPLLFVALGAIRGPACCCQKSSP